MHVRAFSTPARLPDGVCEIGTGNRTHPNRKLNRNVVLSAETESRAFYINVVRNYPLARVRVCYIYIYIKRGRLFRVFADFIAVNGLDEYLFFAFSYTIHEC